LVTVRASRVKIQEGNSKIRKNQQFNTFAHGSSDLQCPGKSAFGKQKCTLDRRETTPQAEL